MNAFADRRATHANDVRRMDIVMRFTEHAADIWDLHNSGIYVAHVNQQQSSFNDRYTQYFQKAAETLSLFEEGEEGVAWWSQVELYAGFADPIRVLRTEPASDIGAEYGTPPRSYMLYSWATNESAGPRYAMQSQAANKNEDTFRHDIIPPQTEVPDDFIWAPILQGRC
ncbi:hypothetical protein [Clavibacter lycopersici]|uniref:hypothetical protein n=1 Tax=Clavibacter lycopersici TaxID=2301718 RepID=UPI0011C23D08|nr:hypothetical protein [Clavibacter lycopersici]